MRAIAVIDPVHAYVVTFAINFVTGLGKLDLLAAIVQLAKLPLEYLYAANSTKLRLKCSKIPD